jgi:putative DNA-invertase from lambdoid prophage Rac
MSSIKRAREQGKVLWRPKVGVDVEQAIRDLRSQGIGIHKIARELAVGVSVVQRVVGDMVTIQD